jgi:flagellar basal-body rod modification protein FlgD
MSVTAQDASGQPVAVSTLVAGTVDSVDLTKNPPLLSVNGQTFTVDQIQGVSRN